MKTLILLSLFVVFVSAEEGFQTIGYKTCKANSVITDVQASNCELSIRDGRKLCIFKQGTSPTIHIHFTPKKQTDVLYSKIRAKMSEKNSLIDFPQANNNACTLNVTCPLKADEPQVFSQTIEITETHPKGELVTVNWQLTDKEDKEKTVCILFLAEIV